MKILEKATFDAKGLSWTIGSVLAVGLAGFVDKLGTTKISNPLWYSLITLLAALGFSLLYVVLIQRRTTPSSLHKTSLSKWLVLVLLGMISSGLFIILRFYGLQSSTATFTTLSQVLTSVVTVFFAALIFKEQLPKIFTLLFPVILIATYFFSTASLSFSAMKSGDLLIILAALLLAGGNMVGKVATQVFTSEIITIGRTIFGLLLVLLAIIFIHPHPVSLNAFLIFPIISGAIMTTNFFCYYQGVRRCGVGFTTSFLMAAPIVTKLLSLVFLGEQLNLLQTVCFGVIILTGYTIVHGTITPPRPNIKVASN